MDIRQRFVDVFGGEPATVVRAPGRVNLIGEHTDYNDGYVLPIAIDRSVLVAAAPRDDRRVVLFALDFGESVEFSLDDIEHDQARTWSNYQRGVAYFLEERGIELPGLNAVVVGDVPIGSGLSSSAAVEVSMAYTWQVLAGFRLSRVELALLCQRAENEFVGMNCGIMDQFVSALGQRDHALLIDCRSLEYQPVPLPPPLAPPKPALSKVEGLGGTGGAAVVVADTMKRRGLLDSEYNTRRRECEEGVRILQRYLPQVQALRDVSVAQFEAQSSNLKVQKVRQRCRHVIHENERVLKGVAALRAGDLDTFGQLMNQSHVSLRDDYQVSCAELDIMVEAAWKVDGVYGSRMTGAGFGGCTVSLVAEGAIEDFRAQLAAAYEEATGIVPQIYVCRAEDGVSKL
ncbi:MAG: galactokinase [Chloroflexi bacterium]|nr:galactokinase [Chloroflexota bacterium]